MPKDSSQRGFVSDSPLSHKDPIFFSVPRNSETNGKRVKLLASKRKLFNLDRNLFDGGNSTKNQQSKMSKESKNDFAKFVQQQASK